MRVFSSPCTLYLSEAKNPKKVWEGKTIHFHSVVERSLFVKKYLYDRSVHPFWASFVPANPKSVRDYIAPITAHQTRKIHNRALRILAGVCTLIWDRLTIKIRLLTALPWWLYYSSLPTHRFLQYCRKESHQDLASLAQKRSITIAFGNRIQRVAFMPLHR